MLEMRTWTPFYLASELLNEALGVAEAFVADTPTVCLGKESILAEVPYAGQSALSHAEISATRCDACQTDRHGGEALI